MTKTLFSLLALSFLAACATTDDVASNDQPVEKEERIYVTGSSLPQKKDRAREVKTVSTSDLKESMRTQPGPSDPLSGKQ